MTDGDGMTFQQSSESMAADIAETDARLARLGPPLTQYQALQRILTETAGTHVPTNLDEARDRLERITRLVQRATATTDLQIVDGWLVDAASAGPGRGPMDPPEPPEPIARLADLPGYEPTARRPLVGDAPPELHAALNLIWAGLEPTDGGGAHTDEDVDFSVQQGFRHLDEEQQRRATFVLAVARSLLMAVRVSR